MTEENQDAALTDNELAELKDLLGYGSNLPDVKHNVHTFLHSVAIADDTTKLGYLKDEELGVMANPIRSYKHLALFAGDIMRKPSLKNFFNSNSEITTATSLSRGGFLVDRAVVQKRELKDTTGNLNKKENKSWFKKKDKSGEQPEQNI